LLLLSIFKLAVVTLDTVVLAPIIVAIAAFDQRAAYRLCQFWARLNLLAFGLRVHMRQLASLNPDSPFVFMSNHRSQIDILAVIDALHDFQLRWVAKKELTRVPVFGWALRHTGHIIIDRSNTQQAVASLRAARTQMSEGISVVIFPEGTRSVDQELLPFKKGGFMLALETGFPIVPMVVCGSRELLPRGSWRLRGGDIEVIVGEPIAVTGLDRDELMRRVETFMREHLGDPARRAAVTAEAV
jgi:1-acyl-sn-glycerol-3-phosphate acyltransferase